MKCNKLLNKNPLNPCLYTQESVVDENDPFSTDPVRSPILHVNSQKPFNAEPPPELLLDNYNTPNDMFFVRNHLPVPKVDSSSFIVELAGEGRFSMHMYNTHNDLFLVCNHPPEPKTGSSAFIVEL